MPDNTENDSEEDVDFNWEKLGVQSDPDASDTGFRFRDWVTERGSLERE